MPWLFSRRRPILSRTLSRFFVPLGLLRLSATFCNSFSKRSAKRVLIAPSLSRRSSEWMAIWRRRPAPGLIFHSDRVSQYCSNDFQKMLKTHEMLSSVSRKGNYWDNAVAESFFAASKPRGSFFSNYTNRENATRDIMDYIEMFYNSNRRHSYLGYVSPKEFEKLWLLKKTCLTKVSIFT